jgi:hypothetical protein
VPAESNESPEYQGPEYEGPEYHAPEYQVSGSPEQERGRSNRADPVSIGSGIVFFLIGGAYLLASGGHLTVNAGWTLSMLALGLGLSGIVGAVLRVRRGGDRRD